MNEATDEDEIPKGYIGTGKAADILGVCTKTLERWRKNGKIKYIRPSTRYYYYVQEFFDIEEPEIERTNYIYARVSTRGQIKDLEYQLQYLQSQYPNHTPIKDIASGLNFKRKGLKTILEQANKGTIGDVVVAHKDRLCRFGFEAIQWIIESGGGKIVVLDSEENSKEEELVQDLIAIITVFSARVHGLRSYKSKIEKDKTLLEPNTEENN